MKETKREIELKEEIYSLKIEIEQMEKEYGSCIEKLKKDNEKFNTANIELGNELLNIFRRLFNHEHPVKDRAPV